MPGRELKVGQSGGGPEGGSEGDAKGGAGGGLMRNVAGEELNRRKNGRKERVEVWR